MQIFGNVKPVAGNKWDGGWIIDPEKNPKQEYDVEITPHGRQKLKVMGYVRLKFLSETMIWTRAPANLQKCTDAAARAPDPAPAAPTPAPAPNRGDDKEPPSVYPPPAATPAPASPPAAANPEPPSWCCARPPPRPPSR